MGRRPDLLPLTERWIGGHVHAIRTRPEAGALEGVVALAADDAWAVGLEILHWDGRSWQLVPD